MKTIVRVLGTRPQFMQAPALRTAFSRRGVTEIMVHTGQHYGDSMSSVFFRDLGLPEPEVNLSVGSHTQGVATGHMLGAIERYLLSSRPDALLVDGDTNSTLAGALAAAKLHIPVIHVEAGLRDFDRKRPEELNRIMSDHLADLNLAPIPRAMDNLANEGLGSKSKLTGDLLCDCFVLNRSKANHKIRDDLGVYGRPYHLMTLHRPENTDLSELLRFKEIFEALQEINVPVIFPVHPRTRPVLEAAIESFGHLGVVRPIAPVGYLDMLGLLDGADCVFTDSGGLPREAAWSGTKVVMLFRVDTWHDMLKNGWAEIGKTDKASILTAYERAQPAGQPAIEYFGGGFAADRVATAVMDLLGG